MKNKRVFFIQKAYDSLTGEEVRWPIRTNDIHNVTGVVANGTSTLVCSTIAAASTNLYPYLIKVSCTGTPCVFGVFVDTATVAVIDMRYERIGQDIITDPDVNPICKVAAASTIELRAITGVASSTYYGMMVMKRVPINTKINP